jgi:hypothetical protein
MTEAPTLDTMATAQPKSGQRARLLLGAVLLLSNA